ncbi:hypothetical protein PUNSTDRAFT_73311, partial [Punctularia strigosozonata HHB-11173 SS5]|uniref:uncharacterized protein n=1 Tax=Punctularia strigosozonata (strain HHB-11173) TaxID=741275 RepID=UPI00044177D3
SRVFRQLLPQLLACNAFLVVSLYAGKEWLLEYEVGVFWVLMRVLACGGLSALVYQVLSGNLSPKRPVEWSVVGLASLSLLVQQACLLTALLRTSPLR